MGEIAPLVYLLIGAAIGLLVTLLLWRLRAGVPSQDALRDLPYRLEDFKDRLSDRFSQELHVMRQELATHLTGHRDTMERSQQNMQRQMIDFTAGFTEVVQKLQRVEGSMREVASFQDVLRTPKLRGRWGEASLEHLLQEYFPPTLYERQKSFSSGEMVDAVLKLPDGRLLPIDSKFPLENFQRMIGAESEEVRARFQKLFLDDVRREIDDVAAKYIAPQEGTTQLALVFIPAESVYYEIVNNVKDFDVSEYARKRNVLLVSPNTFYLTLQVLLSWLRDVRVSQETKEIVKRLRRVIQDAQLLQDDFRKLGAHLANARSSFEGSERRLTLMTDRALRLIDAPGGPPPETPSASEMLP